MLNMDQDWRWYWTIFCRNVFSRPILFEWALVIWWVIASWITLRVMVLYKVKVTTRIKLIISWQLIRSSCLTILVMALLVRSIATWHVVRNLNNKKYDSLPMILKTVSLYNALFICYWLKVFEVLMIVRFAKILTH